MIIFTATKPTLIIRIAFYTAISFLISFLIFPVLIKILTQWKLYDSPGKHKIHSNYKPSMGGIAVLIGAIFALMMSLKVYEWTNQKYFFLSLALMAMIGLRDDILALTPKQKLLSQFLPIFLLVILNGTTLNSTYGLLNFSEIPIIIIWIISAFTIVILTNAYNLIDGLDGLAGIIGVITLTAFGLWFFGIGNSTIALICFTFAGGLLAFLFFNWEPSKIFMGDTGALMIGFLLSYLSITFINTNYQLPANHEYKMKSSVMSAVCVIIIPVFDTLRVIILRLRQGVSPFHADRNHLHHQFLKLGFNHAQSVIFIAIINIVMIVLAWFLRKQNDILILGIIIALCLFINFVLKQAQKKSLNGTENKID